LKAAVEELERHMVQEALVASGYNQVRAARRLGLSRQGLIKKLKRYAIVPRAGTTSIDAESCMMQNLYRLANFRDDILGMGVAGIEPATSCV
jgi:Bacterial regulatory protein, Fis family